MGSRAKGLSLSRRQLIASGALAVTAASVTNHVRAQQATPASPVATPNAGATPTANTWEFQVYKPTIRFDEPFLLYAYGLSPLEEVIIRAAFHDGLNYLWESEASYIADDQGYLNFSATAPVEGSFDVADSMGLIWAAISPTAYRYFPNFTGEEVVEITCERATESKVLRVSRTFGPLQPAPVDIYEPDGIIGTYYPPLAEIPAPAVIIIGGSEGGLNWFYEPMNHLLNQAGYAVLHLAWFGMGHLPTSLANIPLEYFGTAITWLQGQEGVNPDRIGIVGTSRGGEGALLIGSYYPEIRAAVSISGSGLVIPGYPDDSRAAWTWEGKELPFPNVDDPSVDLATYEIQVERINGPILMLSGDADANWFSTSLCQYAWDRLAREGHPFANQFLHYPGNGHAFYQPYQPLPSTRTLESLSFGGTRLGTAITAPAAWAAIKQHLASALKQP